MPGYYTKRLAAERLRACYDLAPPRTKAYLEAEIEFVLAKTVAMDGFLSGFIPECGWRSELIRRLPASEWHWNIWDANHHYALPAWASFKWAFVTRL
jgi:hypothetical protein